MDTRDPTLSNLPPGEFGNVDTRDTHPIPGKEVRPPSPAPHLEGSVGGEVNPALGGIAATAGAGGALPGDPGSPSDGYQVEPPDDAAQGEIEAEPGDPDNSRHAISGNPDRAEGQH